MAKIGDKTLSILRQTIISPLWSVFRRIPGGVRFWLWGVKTLGVQSNLPTAAVDVQAYLADLPAKFKSSLPSVPAPQMSVNLCKLIDLFEGVENPQAEAEHTERYAAFPVTAGCFTMQRMDGRYLEFPDNSFDVVFSLSSIEHFGGHAAAAQAMREVGGVLKPGGVAAIATELILNSVPEPNSSCPKNSSSMSYVPVAYL